MVDQILVAEPEAENPLTQQAGDDVRDEVGVTVIGEAFGQPLAQPDPLVSRAKQNHAAVRGDRTAVESAHEFAPAAASEVHLFLATLCRHRGSSCARSKSLSQNNFD